MRIDHAVRDLVATMLLVRAGEIITPMIALERAANIAAGIVGNFHVEALPEDRPDPAGDDPLICTGGGR